MLYNTMPQEYEAPLQDFHCGQNYEAFAFFGAHPGTKIRTKGVYFRVWAPAAKSVSLVGTHNRWDRSHHPMTNISGGGIWEIFLPLKEIPDNFLYKYSIEAQNGRVVLKADPYGTCMEESPGTATRYVDISQYSWKDQKWLEEKKNKSIYKSPVNIYEVHLNSWKQNPDGSFYSYVQAAEELIPYLKSMGYTHVELTPLSEYSHNSSWGYQVVGYYAPTSRFGSPLDLMKMIDLFHQNGIGVILDWVPAHFTKDECGLAEFDGTYCYEYEDKLKRELLSWGACCFDFGKSEVRSFLISNAVYWLEMFHADGLRVGEVEAILYLDYDRSDDGWEPNENGSNENMEGVDFLQRLNEAVFARNPNILIIAEESTAWPCVTTPTDKGGLGFNFKWNKGWMNDMTEYMTMDPIYRAFNHDKLTFSFFYCFSENFILPLPHDEVAKGKGSFIAKMSGTMIQKFSTLRAFFGYMMGHPGKKLLFMGQEFAQMSEWSYNTPLDWNLLTQERHQKMQNFVKALNHLYLENSCLWENDDSWAGFQWISHDDYRQSVIAFRRLDDSGKEIVVVCNFVPANREYYQIGVPYSGCYEEIFSTDAAEFGGMGLRNPPIYTENQPMHGFGQSIRLVIPALSVVFLRYVGDRPSVQSLEEKAPSEEKPKPKRSRKKTPEPQKTEAVDKPVSASPKKRSRSKPKAAQDTKEDTGTTEETGEN